MKKSNCADAMVQHLKTCPVEDPVRKRRVEDPVPKRRVEDPVPKRRVEDPVPKRREHRGQYSL